MFGLYSISELPFATAVGNVFASSLVESASTVDQNASVATFACITAESVVTVDAVSGSFAINALTQETTTLTAAPFSNYIVNSALAETLRGGETFVGAVNFGVSVTNSIAVSETVAVAVDFAVLINELLSLETDEVSAIAVFIGLVNEAVGVSEEVSSVFVFNSLVQELLLAADALTTSIDINGVIIENAGVTENQTTQVVFNSFATEVLQATDAINSAARFITNIQEGVVAAELFIGRLLWDTINTSETSVWEPIKTSSDLLRVTIGGGFSSGSYSSGPISGLGGVTSIATAPDNWNTINTAQPNDWTPVKTQT